MSEKITNDQLNTILHKALGVQSYLDEFQRISGGQFNAVYELRARNPEKHLVLRVAPPDQGYYCHNRLSILEETQKYELVRQAGIPVPQVLLTDGSLDVLDQPYSVVEFVEAVPLNHSSVPSDVRPGLMKEAGQYINRLHQITAPRFGWLQSDGSILGSESWFDVFGDLMHEAYRNSEKAGVIDHELLERTLECYSSCRSVFDECKTPVLVHNDIWDPNILVSDMSGQWRVEAIIDFDGAFFADREFEFAIWEEGDVHFLSGYNYPLDPSPSAQLRRKFYKMQLHMTFAWFYLAVYPEPEFQAQAKRTALDLFQELSETTRSRTWL